MRRVEGRLASVDYEWPEFRYRKERDVFVDSDLPTIRTQVEEIIILHALAGTGQARQYGVTPRGEVFPSQSFGYLREDDGRLYVNGLSPLIDEIGARFTRFRRHAGGRFYVEDRRIRDAASRRAVLLIEV